jgi:hypothetical protein
MARVCASPLMFSCRNGKDVGRSVSAWGYWGDILNGPYHCFGTVCEDGSYYSVTNKQFGRTAVDIAEHNIMVSSVLLSSRGLHVPGLEAPMLLSHQAWYALSTLRLQCGWQLRPQVPVHSSAPFLGQLNVVPSSSPYRGWLLRHSFLSTKVLCSRFN